LESILNDSDERELIEAHVESKSLEPNDIKWEAALTAAKKFANEVCE
jgi:hypothetical protein